MASTPIHENGMSIILCDLCNRYPGFRKAFCAKIHNFPKKDIDYMWFTGDYETGFGKPDITIRFEDGTFFFIEVKTKCGTVVQENQELGIIDKGERKGYIGLIEYLGQGGKEKVEKSYAFLVDNGHPGFESEKKGIGKVKANGEPEFNVDVVTWNDVINAIDEELEKENPSNKKLTDEKSSNKELTDEESRLSFFREDIKKNVDGVDNKQFSFKINELEFIKNPQFSFQWINKFQLIEKLDFLSNEYEIKVPCQEKGISNNGEEYIPNNIYKFIRKSFEINLPQLGWNIQLESTSQKGNKKYYPENWVWVGFNPLLLDENNIMFPDEEREKNIERADFLFSIAVHGHLLNHEKLKEDKEIKYCIDNSYFFYFPLENFEDFFTQSNENTEKDFNDFVKNKLTEIFEAYSLDNIESSYLTWEEDKKNGR